MRPRSLPVLALLLVAASACGGSPRAALPPGPRAGEQIRRLDVAFEVRGDGVTEVTETIRYDFGPTPRGSFTRVLTAGGTTINRGNGLGRVRASAASGARPVITSYERGGGPLPVDGRQTAVRFTAPRGGAFGRVETFQIRYELRYVLTGDDGRVSLSADLVGEHGRVPVQRLGVRVHGPGPIESFHCGRVRHADRDPCAGVPLRGAAAAAELGGFPAGVAVAAGADFRAENATVLEEPSDRYLRYIVYGSLIFAAGFLFVVWLLVQGSPTPVSSARPPRRPLGRERSGPDFEGAASIGQTIVDELAGPDPTDAGGSIGPDQDQY